jgi:hypothetical protein
VKLYHTIGEYTANELPTDILDSLILQGSSVAVMRPGHYSSAINHGGQVFFLVTAEPLVREGLVWERRHDFFNAEFMPPNVPRGPGMWCLSIVQTSNTM